MQTIIVFIVVALTVLYLLKKPFFKILNGNRKKTEFSTSSSSSCGCNSCPSKQN